MTEYPEFPQDEEPQVQREWYEKQIFDLKQLLDISKLLSANLDYGSLMDAILFTCMGQMKVLKAELFAKKVIDHEHFTLHRNQRGFDYDDARDHRIPERGPLIKLLASDCRCFTLAELRKAIGGEELRVIEALEPTLVVPLKSQGAINGIIILGERIDGGEFSEREKAYLMDIAIFAAIAVQNAVLFEMSTTDMMTKLKLKHFFLAALAQQLEAASQTDSPLSLIMADIDHFKLLNDTYGHMCGDLVLKNVTALIKENIRQNDIAARYGGEEFVILLPQTTRRVAASIAERIRRIIEASAVRCADKVISTTISLGVAEYDRDTDESGDSLIGRADSALYQAKHAGRNQVRVDVP